MSSGVDIIKHYQSIAPSSAGVYRMLDEDGKVLYIGKAKNLPKRIISYTKPDKLPYRLQRMISQTASMELVTTETDAEALLLEANLIKELNPRYNILLKDDKTFPHILVTEGEYPRLMKHRGKRKERGSYFGPFASAGDVNNTIDYLQKIFLLRPCTDSYFKNRTRPCLEYQIKRCSAPCVEKVSSEDYKKQVNQALSFLAGKTREIQESLVKLMEESSISMEYEKAAIYRDRIRALNHIQGSQKINIGTIKDADLIGVYTDGVKCCVQVFFFRGGQNFGNKPYYPTHVDEASEGEILEAFISQFYQKQIPPKEIIVSHELLNKEFAEENLAEMHGSNIVINHPQRGDKYKLLEFAIENAKGALKYKHAANLSHEKILKEIVELFNLPHTPERIEVYDNSHTQGEYPVGAMIVVGREGFLKREYRKFNIKSKMNAGDDYAMLREVLTRRFSRLQKECPKRSSGIWPDFLLIDGGVGHKRIVQEVLLDLQITDQPFACISKGASRKVGNEQYHQVGKEPFKLKPDEPVGHFLQNIRDEVHNYVIGSHRKVRGKSVSKSVLDEISGIGAKRKKSLLQHFGSVRAVVEASVEDIARVDGIDKKIAKKIADYLSS